MSTTTHRKPVSAAARILSGVGHVLATLIVFSLFAAPFMSEAVLSLFTSGIADEQTKGWILRDVAVMLGLAAGMWGTIYFAYTRVSARLRRSKKMAVVVARGTVATETLIVLPVFLLLTFGLGQMGVNSMAGLLTTLGTFEAARTLAVWGPEVGNNRSGTTVTQAMARDRARIAAAAVIAPVAPMSTGNIACSKSTAFRKLIQGMVAAGLAPIESPQKYSTFGSALDNGLFAQRGPAKFAGAYCSVNVTYSGDMRTAPGDTGQGQFRTVVEYRHKMVFPLVGLAFGGTLTAGGWQTTVKRTYELTHHLTPNPELPKDNVL